MATAPTFDASEFPEVDRDLQRNRAVTDTYEPGSTFKLVTASAALENGYGPGSEWPNPHVLELPDTTETLENFGGVTCSGGSEITLADALRQSCNVVFGEIGLELGPEALAEQAWAFGFAPTSSTGAGPLALPLPATGGGRRRGPRSARTTGRRPRPRWRSWRARSATAAS